jgi:ring-1,2-phenylacetyl-CoA epoxidase subunit PaaC
MADPSQKDALFELLLRLGDSTLILGHRLSAWCGHGPVLEEDIAMTNIALDLIGQSRLFLAYAGEIEGAGRDEDELAYKRDAMDWRNFILVEQPNGDFAKTMTRQFLFDAFNVALLERLCGSSDETVAGIAGKAVKEARYHLRHSGGWLVRLGDGTDESHQRTQTALDALWGYGHEMFDDGPLDELLAVAGISVLPSSLKPAFDATVDAVLADATLTRPADDWSIRGGSQGRHSEHLGYLLAEMQFLPRAYPDASW